MHRATPSNTSFRAYSAGGARATINAIDDGKLMQEIAGAFMKGESRDKVEAPRSYGFASVPHDADKDGSGPEAFISFIGGNRSFPVCGPIDDRRHRLLGLLAGDVALFRGKDDGQQLHMNALGTFLSAFVSKKLRLQLVSQGGGGASAGGAQARAGAEAAAGGQAGTAASGAGQKAVYAADSSQYFEVGGEGTESMNKAHTIILDDKETAIFIDGKTKNVYLGGLPDKHKFARVMTEGGLASTNVYARID
jgi:phage gp45-like